MELPRRTALLLTPLLAVAASAAHAGYDDFYLGSGRDGALVVSSATTVNVYASVLAPLAAGDTAVTVSSATGFGAGDLVLLLHTTGIAPEPASGDAAPVALDATSLGRWELARVAAVGGGTLALTEPLRSAFAANVSQVIRVPEYTSVTLNFGASLVAAPWDGSRGGVVAFLASGDVESNGTIQATGRGFRGGASTSDTSGINGCAALDQSPPGGAAKGEGIARSRFGSNQSGRGNVANGAGGGLCISSGGGGGGHGGRGGSGGHSSQANDGSRPVGGMGGSALSYADPLLRLSLGGGGGAGHSPFGAGAAGAAGGGIVFVRARRYNGGRVLASGEQGAGFGSDGAGGGGAGGSIHMRLASASVCNSGLVAAAGGLGGSPNAMGVGPGGGGGGGRILLQESSGGCSPAPFAVDGADAGRQQDAGVPGGPTYGAGAGDAGVLQRLASAYLPTPTPTVVTPASGSVTSNPRPAISGTVTGAGITTVVLSIDGIEVASITPDAAGNFSFTPLATLADGLHTVRARALAGADASVAVAQGFSVDTVPPNTAITQAPATPVASSSAAFFFTATEPGSSFECSLDGGTYQPCAPTQTYSGLADGSHAFAVRARDLAGLADPSPATHAWRVDTTAPDSRLTAAPPASSNDRAPGFAFTSDDAAATYQCRLDSAAFAACTSPLALSGLADGAHRFEVRAIDALGNVESTPALHAWNVDATAPETTFTAVPAAETNSSTADFSFTSDDVAATYECRVDQGAFAGCVSPWRVNGLADGQHRVEVRARDALGNLESSPARHEWRIDTLAPETTLTDAPDSPVNLTTADFAFASDEATASFECRLDAAAFAPCASPLTLVGLADGEHAFEVRARDGVGNVDATPASHAWRIDTTPPDTRITGMPNDIEDRAEATFTFNSEESGVEFECRLDAGAFVACVSPRELSGLTDGVHSFHVRARDAAGNVDSTPARFAWGVDTQPPETGILVSPPSSINVTRATLEFESSEGGSDFECSLDGEAAFTCASPHTFEGLAEGVHDFAVQAIDLAGNSDPTPAVVAWIVDLTSPDTQLTEAPLDGSGPEVRFGFASNEDGARFECSVDAAPFTACVSPQVVSGLGAGPHVFSVRAIDAAGNPDPSAAGHAWTTALSLHRDGFESIP